MARTVESIGMETLIVGLVVVLSSLHVFRVINDELSTSSTRRRAIIFAPVHFEDFVFSQVREGLWEESVSASTFDLRIRPLYPHSGTEMPVCVEIEANVLSQSKEYATTLIVLADVSGSMWRSFASYPYSVAKKPSQLKKVIPPVSTFVTSPSFFAWTRFA